MMMIKFILPLYLLSIISTIEIPLHKGRRCMIITTTFEPLKVEIKFPTIPNKKQGEKFAVSMLDFITQEKKYYTQLPEGMIFRKNFDLQVDKLYHLCIQLLHSRSQFGEGELYVEYSATEDFQSIIGNVQIPKQLQGQKNLEQIYRISESMRKINEEIILNQGKERELESKLTISNIHKNERIILLTLVQCLVIVLSGIYQIFALRRFLIEKNLY